MRDMSAGIFSCLCASAVARVSVKIIRQRREESMEINAFADKVCKAVKRELGADYRVEVKKVRKNNGVVHYGLLILPKGQNVAPTIYLDAFLEAYEQGSTFGALISRLLAVYDAGVPGTNVDLEFFRSFEKVKDRICYRLIGRKGNEELLQDMPYIEFLDLAICFYYAYQGEQLGEGSILIRNSHVEMWQTCTAELLGLAQKNTPRLFPWVCGSLRDIMSGMPEPEGSGREEESLEDGFLDTVPMRVLTNEKRTQGAVCMLYPEVLDQLAAKEAGSFYIFPSSVHEVILMADTGAGEAEGFKRMIVEINDTQVAPEEVLSDSLYYYDSAEKRVKIIF